MRPSPLALAALHLDLLYERDDAGLLLRSRDPAVTPPLVHLVRTTDGNRWLLSASLSEERRGELQEALASERVISALSEMESRRPAMLEAPLLLANERYSWKEARGPAFLFPDSLPPISTQAELLLEAGDAETVPELAWVRAVAAAAQPLFVARDPGGVVVAICHSARSTAEGAEAGVETAAAYRGRGFGIAVVAAWAAAVREEGRLPLYSTQWTNLASRAVARKLGLVMYGEDCSLRAGPGYAAALQVEPSTDRRVAITWRALGLAAGRVLGG